MTPRLSAALLAILYAAAAGVWIVASQVLVDTVTDDPVLGARLEVGKGLLFVFITSILFYLALRSTRPAAPGDARFASDGAGAASIRHAAPILLAILLAAPLVAIGIYALQSKQEERRTFDNLSAIAELKTGEIERWIVERKGDGDTLVNSTGFVERVARLTSGNAQEARLVRDRMVAMQRAFAYPYIVLLDARSAPVLSIGTPHHLTAPTRDLIRKATDSGRTQMGDIHRDEAGNLHLELVAPLQLRGPGAARHVGTVVMHIEPNAFLRPLVQNWPLASASGEALLVHAEGDTLVYLIGSARQQSAPLSLQLPLDAQSLPAAIAAREKRPGTTHGTDYRGFPVLAAYRPVAGTDWHLIAKIDHSEALAPARTLAYWMGLVTLFAMLTVGAAILLLMRQQARNHGLAMQLQSTQIFRHFYNLPFIGMAITSPATKIWEQFNDRLCDILGYSREELAHKTWTEITHPEDLEKDVAEFQRVLRGDSEGYALEKRFIRKDGAVVFAIIDVKCVRKPDGAVDFFVATVDDITENKQAEARVLRLNRMYATLSRCNEAIVRCANEDELYAAICRTAVESGAFSMVWVGMVDPTSRMVRPVASFGPGTEYLDGISISIDSESPNGRGPTGVAIREDRAFWCQDFRNNPATAPWQARAARYGWAASSALPLHREGVAVGALTLYSDTVGAFDDETQKLLTEMAADVSFALNGFSREAERRQVTDQLRASEERFRLLYDSSQDGIMLTAPDGRILAANPAACRIFGWSEAELCAGGRQLITDTSDPRLPAAIAERERTGRFSGELNMLRSDGTKFPAEISTAIFQDRNRETRSSMIIRDATERRRAELALRQSERQFRSMVEQSIAGFYVIQDGKFAYVNQRLADILGYDAIPDLLGRDILSFIPEEQRDTVAGYLREVIADKAPGSGYTVQAIRKDGSRIEIGANAAAVVIAGEPAIMGLMQDISEKKHTEEQIQRYIEQLKTAFMRTVEVAMNLSEMRDPYTAGHEKRVAEIAVAIGTEMGFDERRLEGLRVAGYLHDIGKITVPAEILARPGKLSANEYALIKQHPQAGYDVLKNVEFPWPVALCALQHHERVDGSGYPQGLKGNDICEEARVLAVADTIEAMSSHRPYRAGLGLDKALAEIERGRGTAYDAQAANAALRLFRDKGFSIPA